MLDNLARAAAPVAALFLAIGSIGAVIEVPRLTRNIWPSTRS